MCFTNGIVKKRIALTGRGKRGSTRILLATNWNDKRTMREFDVLCVKPVSAYSAEQIRSLRERYRLSQAVMATVLNTSLSTIQKWEIWDKRPGGPSLKHYEETG